MTITNRQLSILAVTTAVLLLATVLLYGIERKPTVEAQKGAILVQGLDLEKVARIRVAKKDQVVTLEKKDAGYSIAERKGYPASAKKVNDLLIDILGIRIADKVTASAANHADLGVAKGGEEATSIEFADKDGKPLVDVFIGKSTAHGGGNYVRTARLDTVYASEKSLWPSTSVTSYIDTDVVDVKKDDVQECRVEVPGAAYAVVRNAEKKIVLSEIPKGKKPKEYEVESVFGALSGLSFSDVLISGDNDLTFDATYAASAKDHMSYTVRLAKKGEKHYAKFAARGASAQKHEEARRIGKDDPKEKLEEKDRVLTSVDKAKQFNEKHGPWVYELSSWKADTMRKPLKDLLEDEAKEPEEIAARHILVAYKGSERADAKIARTKEEARKRAEELLAKVKEAGADFAEIAKRESDEPGAKEKGGDLGTFKKGVMHKNFEEAAWKLKVDELSGVVESPFGFHIIKRTK
jgi:hypothetical protein